MSLKPKFHFTPERNWINDPNGLCWYGGKYHLFYQHYPYAPKWGTMHWGHAISDDLAHWQHLPIALHPTKEYDRDGIYSGSALIKNEKMYLYYTAIKYLETNPEDISVPKDGLHQASQALLISEDGMHFDNFNGKKQIIPPITDPTLGDYIHTRDPKVWALNGKYYLVLGSKIQETGKATTTPRLLFYVSDDAENWTFLNHTQLYGALGNMWECPDIFTCKDDTVLTMSPEQMRKEAPTNNAMFGIVGFDNTTCTVKMQASDFRFVDYGLDYYAPQSFADKDGGRVQLGWLRCPHAYENVDGSQWFGVMTLPRLVSTQNGQIITRPHPNVRAAFPTGQQAQGPYRMERTLKIGEALKIGSYTITFDGTAVTALRSGVPYSAPALGSEAQLEIFVDGCVIETYINNGKAVITHVCDTLC